VQVNQEIEGLSANDMKKKRRVEIEPGSKESAGAR
jgi:hypothetical protein